MAYFKINNIDFSDYVATLKVTKQQKYKSVENAAGNLTVKSINSKYVIDVGFIPLEVADMKRLLPNISNITVSVSFLAPDTNELKTIKCMIASNSVEYYTIQSNGTVLYKPFTVQFQQL